MNDLNCFGSSSQVLSKNPSINPSADSPVLRSEGSCPKPIGAVCTFDSVKHEEFLTNREVMFARMHWIFGNLQGCSPAYCMSCLVKGRSPDGIVGYKPAHLVYTPEKRRAALKGVFLCKDNMCPNCLKVKGLTYMNQLSMVEPAAVKAGFRPVMLTLTHRHTVFTSLRRSQAVMQKAFLSFSSGKNGYRNLIKNAGLKLSPTVKAVECPFTENGWHLHFHLAFWVDIEGFKSVDWGSLEKTLAKKWIGCVVKAGGSRPSIKGQKFSFGEGKTGSLGTYIANELIDSAYKEDVDKFKFNIMTMIDIARGARTVEGIEPEKATRLVKEYYSAMKGTSKVRGIKDLAKFFGVDVSTEREEVDALVFDDVVIYTFTDENNGNGVLAQIKRLGFLPVLLKHVEMLYEQGWSDDEVKAEISITIDELMDGVFGAVPSLEELAVAFSNATANRKAMDKEDFEQRKVLMLEKLLLKQEAKSLSHAENDLLSLWSLEYDDYLEEVKRRKDLRRVGGNKAVEREASHYSEFF